MTRSPHRPVATSPEERIAQRLAAEERRRSGWRAGPMVSDERLRFVRGIINTTGGTLTIVKGDGQFTAVRNAAGNITITFIVAFGDTPTCTGNYGTSGFNATAELDYNTPPSTTQCRFMLISADGTQVGRDGYLHFTAVGPP